MSQHVTISPGEAADRLAIRELVEAYAHYADRRDAQGQMSLFTPDTHFRGVHERQRSDAFPGVALARSTSAGVRRPEPVRRDHAFARTDDDSKVEWRPRHGRNLLHASSPHD